LAETRVSFVWSREFSMLAGREPGSNNRKLAKFKPSMCIGQRYRGWPT
jgi:hypothetical protein